MRNLQNLQNLSGFTKTVQSSVVQTLSEYMESISGLRVYYPMDETSGAVATNNAPDTLGTLNGAITGATVNQSGQSGQAYSFDGTGDLVQVNDFNFYGDYTSHSVVILMNCAAAADKKVITLGKSDTNTPLWQLATNANGGVTFYIRNDANSPLVGISGTASTSNTFCESQWHMLVLTDANGTVKLYQDGVLDAANLNYTRSGTFTFNRLAMGALVRTTTIANYLGLQQHAAIVNGILTQEQVTELAELAGLA